MESICSTDSHFASEISALLKPSSPCQVEEYFNELIKERQFPGIKVKQDEEFGKSVYAERDFKEGDLVLKDKVLVGAQHSSNKIGCFVCGFCFCFIGSIELQIGKKLYLQKLGASINSGCHMERISQISGHCCQSGSSDEENDTHIHQNLVDFSSSSSKDKDFLSNEIVESLMNGEMMLPYSGKFVLPSHVSCPGGCREVYYCSKLCADADWELSHSLLCTGDKSSTLCKEALLRFIQHANESNDIFLLAAKAISFTILRYRKLKEMNLKEQEDSSGTNICGKSSLILLLEAFKPISMGCKRRWWECIALPDDVVPSDEATFRMQIRELAFMSLQLLKAAILDRECEPLFSLEIYGHIIGMFELNNLELVVASPVEDYFLYIDELPYSEKKEAEKITQSILDALGDDYSIYCQGTAFFPLQSCMNHSCCPNAKAFKREEDRDGQATIIALRPISKGEEVTISYIDEDLPYEERLALLADYGFICKCPKCHEKE